VWAYSEKHTSKVLHGFPDHIPCLWNVQAAVDSTRSLGFNRLCHCGCPRERHDSRVCRGPLDSVGSIRPVVPVFHPALAGQKVSATCICSWLTLVAEEAWRSILAPIKAGTPAPCQMTCRSGHPINLQNCREDACIKQRPGMLTWRQCA
jgi:hypothetical protein